jgi:hypothetical protein
MGVVTLLYGVGVLRLGENGWNAISLTILVGAVVLTCLPATFLGKYRMDRVKARSGRTKAFTLL